jgi:carbamoyltransferase
LITLGISDSHEAHACIVRDGQVVAAMAEERLSRIKSDAGYPRKSIEAVLQIAGITPNEVDIVAFAGGSSLIWRSLYNKHANFSVADWIDECQHYWKPVLLEGKKLSPFTYFDRFRERSGQDFGDNPYFPFLEIARNADKKDVGRLGDEFRKQVVLDHLGISGDKVMFFRHESCHQAYALYSSPYSRKDALILTLEGGGDDSSCTISTTDKAERITEHWKSNIVQIGRLYAYVTLLLGMKPGQHEYKVMGLAPYGNHYHGHRSLEFFRTINSVDGTNIIKPNDIPDLYYSVRDAIEGERFDGVAWGLQTWLEEIVSEWVTNCAKHYNTDNILFSGGVAQNIKAMKNLAELPEVGNLWAGPISGDGSLAFGAAWLASRSFAPDIPISGFSTVYLGTEYDSSSVNQAVKEESLQKEFQLIDKPSSDQVAGWLEQGKIVSRYSGRMEFGQRALGNRSILADPRRAESVERINQKIKYRDFWMPFTPSMTIEESERMIVNPKKLYSPFMTMAFDLKPEFSDTIPAATHPADKTIRPQMLRRDDNPGYYDLMTAFGKKTGVNCLMNTSFNLHGEAIVESPKDAISTFKRSELDVLLFDDIAISRSDVG